jgi:DNA-binding protein H-NS
MAVDLDALNQKQLNELILRAEERKQVLRQERLVRAREKIDALATSEGFTIEELFALGRKRARKAAAKPKFRNPMAPHETWSGRGRAPRWYVAAVKAGKKDKDLLIP